MRPFVREVWRKEYGFLLVDGPLKTINWEHSLHQNLIPTTVMHRYRNAGADKGFRPYRFYYFTLQSFATHPPSQLCFLFMLCIFFFTLLAFLICERDIMIKCIQYFVDELCLYVFSSNREVFAFVCLLLSQFDSFLSCLCGLVGLFLLLCRLLVNRAFNSVQLEAR